MSHNCPVRKCGVTGLPDHLLMCGPHWGMVPRALQRPVYREYDQGRGVGANGLPLPPLAEAQLAAIMAVETRLGMPPRLGYASPVTDTR